MKKETVWLINNCLSCNKEIKITEYRVNRGEGKYCSKLCYDKVQRTRIRKKCDWCETDIEVPQKKIREQSKHFCSLSCSSSYFGAKRKESRLTVSCEQCSKEYKIKPYQKHTTRFCSRECVSEWQKINFKGDKSPVYKERVKVNCSWCNQELLRNYYRIKTRKNHFCDADCRKAYHKNIFSQTDEWKEFMRKEMISRLEQGLIPSTLTKPHEEINQLLDENNIKYENEFSCEYYSVDIYLPVYNLFIEIMGTFWHCDRRIYDLIGYEQQVNRIISDKAKRTYIRKRYKTNTLYLWELDINTDRDMCEELIKHFIKSEGKLYNYHSNNYFLGEDNELLLNEPIETHYMDMTAAEASCFIDLSTKEKMSRIQEEKHMKFDCDNCGEEADQRLIQYLRSEKHYCSRKCKNEAEQHGLRYKYNCKTCNNEVYLKKNRHEAIANGQQNDVFCSRDCKWKYQETIKGENHPAYNSILRKCEYCENEYPVINSRKEISKFCSPECRQKSSRSRIIINCAECGEKKDLTPTQYNRSKTHFCSHKCADTYRSKQSRLIKKCEICNEEFEVIRSQSKKRFCTMKCQSKWQSVALIGTKANNYKGKGRSNLI